MLAEFVGGNLTDAVEFGIDDAIINGAVDPLIQGTWDGLLVDANVRELPYDAALSPLDAIRLGMNLIGRSPEWYSTSGMVASHDVWTMLELEKDSTGRYLLDGPAHDRAARRLWSTPLVVSPSLDDDQDTVILGDFATSICLFVADRGNVHLSYSEHHADNFGRNLVTWRAEARVGLAILAPRAFVRVHLAPPRPLGCDRDGYRPRAGPRRGRYRGDDHRHELHRGHRRGRRWKPGQRLHGGVRDVDHGDHRRRHGRGRGCHRDQAERAVRAAQRGLDVHLMGNVLGEAPREPEWPEIDNRQGDPIHCHQAQLGYEGAFRNYWQEEGPSPLLQCGQARLARDYYEPQTDWDDPGAGGLTCGQARIATRLANPLKVCWWGDPVAQWGEEGFTWSGQPIPWPPAGTPPPPILTSVEPDTGPAFALTVLTLRGSGFADALNVTVGGVSALETSFINNELAYCYAPGGPPGAVDVVVVHPGGPATLVDGFTYS